MPLAYSMCRCHLSIIGLCSDINMVIKINSPENEGLNLGTICGHICSFIHLSIHASPLPLSLIIVLFSSQFDHYFVEVHRVRKFRFQPRHQDLVSLENLSETPEKMGFSPICSTQTACSYSTSHSSWTCDGEILPHTAIQVR